MCCNGCPCGCFQYFSDLWLKLMNLLTNSLYDLWITSGVCNKNSLRFNIRAILQPIFHVGTYNLFDRTAIFPCRYHASAFYFDAGLGMKHICAKCGQRRTPSASVQIIDTVGYKACFYSWNHAFTKAYNLLSRNARLCKLSSLQHR